MRPRLTLTFAVLAAAASTLSLSAPLPSCSPKPKPLHFAWPHDNREIQYRHEGDLALRLTISKSGRVVVVEVTSSPDPWLDDRAKKAALGWRYPPQTRACTVEMTVRNSVGPAA